MHMQVPLGQIVKVYARVGQIVKGLCMCRYVHTIWTYLHVPELILRMVVSIYTLQFISCKMT